MIAPATPQLLDLAAAMRGDDWRDQLSLALVACRNAGWSWERTLVAAVRLMVREDAFPVDLVAAARSPLERHPASEELTREGAARARAALTEALGET